jgi:hypothetical protein
VELFERESERGGCQRQEKRRRKAHLKNLLKISASEEREGKR